MKTRIGASIIVFSLLWSAIIMFFDGQLVYAMYRQWRATAYAVTEGTVLSSTVEVSESDDSTTHRPIVRYRYHVNDQEFFGDRLTYGVFFSMGALYADAIVSRHPPGSSVPVYFNPADPADALLRPGIGASQLILALALAPFNAVTFYLWAVLAGRIRRRRTQPVAGGLRIETGFRGTSVHLGMTPALGAGMATVGALAIVGVIGAGFFGGPEPRLAVVTGVWIAILAGGLVATVWQAARNRSDAERLLLSPGGDVNLPPTFGRRQRLLLRGPDLAAVRLTRRLETDSDGDSHPKFAIALDAKQGSSEQLAFWSDEARARSFAAWLAERLHVPLIAD